MTSHTQCYLMVITKPSAWNTLYSFGYLKVNFALLQYYVWRLLYLPSKLSTAKTCSLLESIIKGNLIIILRSYNSPKPHKSRYPCSTYGPAINLYPFQYPKYTRKFISSTMLSKNIWSIYSRLKVEQKKTFSLIEEMMFKSLSEIHSF